METKKIILPSQFISKPSGRGTYKVMPPLFKDMDVRLHVNVEKENSVYLDRPQDGSLMLQEFWDSVEKKIYFDVNEKGELVAVFPEGYDGFIDENGDLILVEGSIEFPTDGIGFWIVEDTFIVQ